MPIRYSSRRRTRSSPIKDLERYSEVSNRSHSDKQKPKTASTRGCKRCLETNAPFSRDRGETWYCPECFEETGGKEKAWARLNLFKKEEL